MCSGLFVEPYVVVQPYVEVLNFPPSVMVQKGGAVGGDWV